MSSDERPGSAPPLPAGGSWLGRPGTIRVLWIVFIAVLAATVAAELLVHLHPRFRLERWFGFHAAWGFLSCVAMVLFANLLGVFLRRPDDYYARLQQQADDEERRGD
jgi:H+/Cl- antiporter ClcA